MSASRDDRIEGYYCPESGRSLAEWVVDLEDRVEALKAKIATLQADSDHLARLEEAGVDNWEGYCG